MFASVSVPALRVKSPPHVIAALFTSAAPALLFNVKAPIVLPPKSTLCAALPSSVIVPLDVTTPLPRLTSPAAYSPLLPHASVPLVNISPLT